MPNKKILSIITVTYNCRNTIEKTITNILHQKRDEVEYIVIDGKSTDDTLSIIEKYNSKIDQLISEPDNGIYDAMNKGLRLANGQYVLFINAGDSLFDNTTIEFLIAQLEQLQPDIYYGETMLVDLKGTPLGTRSQLTSRPLPKELTWKSLKRGMTVSHQSFIVKKKIAPEFDLSYTSSADIDWVIKCLKIAKQNKILPSNRILSNYLVNGYSKTTLKTSLIERFHILQHHYGVVPNLYNHLIITLRAIYLKIKGKHLN